MIQELQDIDIRQQNFSCLLQSFVLNGRSACHTLSSVINPHNLSQLSRQDNRHVENNHRFLKNKMTATKSKQQLPRSSDAEGRRDQQGLLFRPLFFAQQSHHGRTQNAHGAFENVDMNVTVQCTFLEV